MVSMKSEMERVFRPRIQARKSYNALSHWYDLFTNSEKRFTDMGIDMLNIQPDESVLEIGSGTGYALVKLANKGAQVYAMDISEGMINVARKRIQNKVQSRGVGFCMADGISIPFPDVQFDAVFLSFTLELFDSPEIPLVLKECHRVLKHDGQICIVSLVKREILAVHIYEWFHRKMPDLVDCRPIYLQFVLQNANFAIERSMVKTMWGLPVEVVIARK